MVHQCGLLYAFFFQKIEHTKKNPQQRRDLIFRRVDSPPERNFLLSVFTIPYLDCMSVSSLVLIIQEGQTAWSATAFLLYCPYVRKKLKMTTSRAAHQKKACRTSERRARYYHHQQKFSVCYVRYHTVDYTAYLFYSTHIAEILIHKHLYT